MDTFFDLASLTKPMTALAVVWSGMDLRAPLASYLPEISKCAREKLPLEWFLTHRAGLLPHVRLDLLAPRGDELRFAADAVRGDGVLPGADGYPPLYSDLAYILVGAALARFTGVPDAGAAIERFVTVPLGLDTRLGTARSLGQRDARFRESTAPTEITTERGEIRGGVHDENAWALTGLGASGHAGMFGTAEGVLRFACEVCERAHTDERVSSLIKRREGGAMRAGFDGKSGSASSVGSVLGDETYGHLGFTGTSFWIDPALQVAVVLLTNRVHPSRENMLIRDARPRVHDALAKRALALR